MTLMLASVVDASEAALALQGGADIVGFADAPAAAGLETVRQASGGVEPWRICAALGDPPDNAEALVARARALREAGAGGLRLAVDPSALAGFESAFRALAGEIDLIGVLFADREPDFELVPRLAEIGFKGAFLDLAESGGKRLIDCLAPPGLEAYCTLARRHGLAAGLAGALQPPDVPRLLLVKPAVLAFGAALRAGGRRDGPLDPRRIALIRDLIPRAAGTAREPDSKPGDEVDTVFVRDFIATAEIGAYAHERGLKQRLRFTVEASVSRNAAHADDMRAIFSYDVILDAIRIVLGRGHIDFLETIAEDVAALVLAQARLREIRVRVEKLDVVEGSIGIEIRRAR